METAALVRTARRHAGLSQRQLAVAAGVHRSSVEAVEAGRREPSVAMLHRLLDAVGLELGVERRPPRPCPHVLRHLRLSLSARLHVVLGGSGRPRVRPAPPGWQALDDLAARGSVFLTGAPAVGLWLPTALDTGAPLVVGWRAWPGAALPAVAGVVVRPGPPAADCTIAVPLPARSVRTPAPGALALHPECAPWRQSLRTVADLLDRTAPVDTGGRRQPAHREPTPEDDAWRLLFARRWTDSLRPPDRLDGRGWRLDDQVGMRQWIEHRAGRR